MSGRAATLSLRPTNGGHSEALKEVIYSALAHSRNTNF